MTPSIGDCFDGRYQIRGRLGAGATAEVYRALDLQTGQEVVLKLPDVRVVGDLAAFSRYRREAEIAHALDHPGVQRALVAANPRYSIFVYVPGESLRRYLAARGQLPVDEVRRIGIQLADTLAYVHQQGIVHRDLKPDNLLIGPDGQVTITDFGIAQRFRSRWPSLTHLANAAGTPDYMPPEQVRGQRGDPRTDIYALGCLLYELLVGVVPYPAESTHAGARTDPPLVRRLRPEVPAALEAILYRAVRRRPAERYQSMRELAHDLAQLEAVQVPASYEPDEPAPAPLGDLPPPRMLWPVLAGLLAVLLLVGVLAQFAHHAAPK